MREDLVHLLRREDGGRLVEDEDARVSIQELEELDALLLPDGEIFDARARVDREAVVRRELRDPFGRRLEVHDDPARLVAEDDVLGHGHRVHQHEVLVHHPDAGRDRVVRAPDVDHRPVDRDRSFVRPVEAVRDAHRGRLPRAVLTDDRVDRPGTDAQAHPVVRHDRPEPLRHPPQLEHYLTPSAIASVTLIRPAMISFFASSASRITSGGIRLRLY